MPVDAIGTASDTSAADATTAAIQNPSNQLGEQAFLKLLVTQLTNQDPLNPQDQSQFLAQLAQFSTVEGVNNLQSAQNRQQGANLLGKIVDAQIIQNNLPQLVSGKVTAVRWDKDGVHLSVEGSQKELTLDEVVQVRDP
ncbi:MAG TPA: flagellar hook capping FlgD N-terminal domain-containing protein [Chthonomonadaceae bacterium]|nr:flagellar hook capping FlgD N-terminal domain-containing protein [Chthonomonadaceae bacterium]